VARQLSCGYSDTSRRLSPAPRSRERGVETSERVRRRSAASGSRRNKNFTSSLANGRRRFRLFQGAQIETEKQSAPHKRRKQMRIDKYLKNNFLNVDDIKASGPIQGTIACVTEGRFEKLNLIFDDGTQVSCNQTSCKALARAYGKESDGWIGKKVEVTLGKIQYNDETQEIILVKPISPAIAPPKPAFGDAISF
jgi:hypothetical protein